MGVAVETYYEDGVWRNRVVGGSPLPGVHPTREAAIEASRTEARIRGVDHVIRRSDGTVEQRNRYPRTSAELPG